MSSFFCLDAKYAISEHSTARETFLKTLQKVWDEGYI
jgi:hypothetical protein